MVKDPFFLVTEKPTEVTVFGITETTPSTIPLRTPCATMDKSDKLFALMENYCDTVLHCNRCHPSYPAREKLK